MDINILEMVFVLICYLVSGLIYYVNDKKHNKKFKVLTTILTYLLVPILWVMLWNTCINGYYTTHDFNIYDEQNTTGKLFRLISKSLWYIGQFIMMFGYLIIDFLIYKLTLWGNNIPQDNFLHQKDAQEISKNYHS